MRKKKKFDGHFYLFPRLFGDRITIYGDNAMHYGITVWTNKWGFICFRLPLKSCGKWWPLYFYVSPNATPWASTFYLGPDRREKWLSKIRRVAFGHNFDTFEEADSLYCINDLYPHIKIGG